MDRTARLFFNLIGVIFLLLPHISFAANFTVTNNNASGAGSLSQAITDLNNSGTNGSSAYQTRILK